MKALEPALVMDLLARRMPDLDEVDRRMVAGLAEGSIGRALALAEAGGTDLYRDISELLLPLPKLDGPQLHRLADKLARGNADGAFRTAGELLLGWLSRMLKVSTGAGDVGEIVPGELASMRRMGAQGPASRWIEHIETIRRQFALVEGLNLDRRQVWVAAMLGLQRMAAG